MTKKVRKARDEWVTQSTVFRNGKGYLVYRFKGKFCSKPKEETWNNVGKVEVVRDKRSKFVTWRKVGKNYRYCFVKGFHTERGKSLKHHWVETSVDVHCEFVVSEGQKVPDDLEMIAMIENFLSNHKTHSWIMSLTQVKHVWGVEREETDLDVSFPISYVSAWKVVDDEVEGESRYAQPPLIDREELDLGKHIKA